MHIFQHFVVKGQVGVHAFELSVFLFQLFESPDMYTINARIAFLPVVKGGFGNPYVAAYDLDFFASFAILEGMYDLAFGERVVFIG
jgi:hypothetical protein